VGLRKYIVKRALDSVVTVFLVFMLNFFICYQNLAEAKGLPESEQFANYIRFVFLDRFGTVDVAGSPNTLDYILGRLSYSLIILIVAAIFAILIGVAFGALASFKRGSKTDLLFLGFFVMLIMIPNWWSAFFLLANFSPPFPAGKFHSFEWINVPFLSDPFGKTQDFLWHTTLPMICLTLSMVGIYFLVARSCIAATFSEPYLITAKAKGVKRRSIIFRHALRNAIVPIAAGAALIPVFLINASISVERVYSLKGIGDAIYRSLITESELPRADVLPTLPALFLLIAIITIIIQYALDLLNYQLDPRLGRSMTDGAGLTVSLKSRRWESRKVRLKRFVSSFMKGSSGKFGLAIIIPLFAFALLSPILPLANPELTNPLLRNQSPSLEHLFGTDEFGRDVLSRTLWASRVSLAESLGALLIAILAGTIIGMISGYYRDQPIGYMLDRFTDVFLSVPIVFVVLFFPIETGSLKWILAVGLSTWAIMAKIVRSQVLVTREKTYIESAKALGASDTRIFLSYILPDAMGVIAANVVYIAGLVILIQTTLDFFGFKRFLWSKSPDLRPVTIAPTLSWGSMLSYSMPTFLSLKTWWAVVPPLACIVLLGLALILIGNKITELLNPHVRTAYELIGEV
jgi:ABC-type dipeptide/oligopeptide/nickel transport system permease subunit